jgi:hypothetical protein
MMGREVRRVPKNWNHPTDKRGNHVPLLEGPFSAKLAEWDEGARQWAAGMVEDWINGGWKPKDAAALGCESHEEWSGKRPEAQDYMPEWPEAECTHLMMYETCSEGTPISPAFETPEELARWLADNEASAFGDQTASYEAWLSACKRGWSPSGVVTPTSGGIISGVEGLAKQL